MSSPRPQSTTTTAEIHDLGHAAYTGPRVPPSRRLLVIARNVIGVAARRWAVRIPLILAAGTAVTAAVVMYFLRLDLTEMVRSRGAPIPKAEAIVFMAGAFFEFEAFLLALLVSCASVADDLRMGAFQFYFARAIRPRDYVAGKLLGLGLLIGLPMLVGPLVLAIMRLVYAESLGQAGELWLVVPRALAHGLLGTVAYVIPPVGLGALAGRRQPAQALYAVYFLVLTPAAYGLSQPLGLPLLRAVSLPNDLSVLGEAIFGLPHNRWDPPVLASLISFVLFTGLGIYAVWRRVRNAETAGLVSG